MTSMPRLPPAPTCRSRALSRSDARSGPSAPIAAKRPPTQAPNVLLDPARRRRVRGLERVRRPGQHADGRAAGRAAGLKYTRFHTTALCSPTRAALLSGRNHHQVGMGDITEIATPAPGYSSIRPNTPRRSPRSCARTATTPRSSASATRSPVWETGPTGPFDHWPRGRVRAVLRVHRRRDEPVEPRPLYEGSAGRAATRRPRRLPPERRPGRQGDRVHPPAEDLTPDKPFFAYFAPGATHAPHHVPKEWVDRYKGKFDQGWDKLREETFARQKELGVIPPTPSSPRGPRASRPGTTCPTTQKPMLARLMEVYAGFLEYADHHIGRVHRRPGGARRSSTTR